MRPLREAWHRIRSLRRRGEIEAGLDEEIRFHLDRQTEKNVRAGVPPDEARRLALVAFGGVERTRESARDEFRLGRVEDLVRDLRHAARALLREPGYSTVAVVTLALGIGATTAMFSVVDGVLLRPLPYPEPDRLVELVHEAPGLGLRQLFASPAIYFTYRDHSRAFESVGLWNWSRSPATVTGSGEPESVRSLEVTPEVLPMLGASPVVGRGFTEADDRPASAPTVILSHAYSQRRFGGAQAVGQVLVVNGTPRRVIGVLPPSFRFFATSADIFYPLQPDRSAAVFPSFSGRGIARLRKGVTLAQADADVARMIPILIADFGRPAPRFYAELRPRLRRLKDSVVGDLGETLWLLMGTIGLLLAIACANVSNLVLARTERRRPELAIRVALGAGRAAIARAVLAESAILGLAGAIGGAILGYLALPLLTALAAEDLPGIMTVSVDPVVLLATLGISAAATLLFALAPVLQSALPRRKVADALRPEGRAVTEGPRAPRVRHALLVAQLALAMVLLIGCGLMVRTFQALRRVDPGLRDPELVQTFQLTIPAATGHPSGGAGGGPGQTIRTQQAILDRIAAIPGVESAGFSAFNDALPLDGDGRTMSFVVEGRAPTDGVGTQQETQFVSPGFLETLGTPLVTGRAFDWDDVHQGRRVALVSENLALSGWGSPEAALGRRIGTSSSGPWWDVVGVIGDVRHDGLSQPAPQVVAVPVVDSPVSVFVVRSRRVGTPGFLQDVRRAMWAVDPDLATADVRTMGDLYRRSMARTSLALELLAITGTMALLLGAIGTYGIVGYAVSQRRREIGIRMALGAATGDVRLLFVRRALVLAGIGVAVGAIAGAGLAPLMRSQIFGVSSLDPITHAAVALSLLSAAGLASYVSARRASSLNPVEVLKGE